MAKIRTNFASNHTVGNASVAPCKLRGIAKQETPLIASDPILLWNSTSPESIISRLYDDSDLGASEAMKQAVSRQLSQDKNLSSALSDLRKSLLLNPVQPRTHAQTATLEAMMGRPWRKSFANSTRLSFASAKQTLNNGLLAWAADDKKSMIQQWRQNLTTSNRSLYTIYQLSSLRLDENEIVNDLMPDQWFLPYRLAQRLRSKENVQTLREKLLARSLKIAKKTLLEDLARYKALGIITSAQGDFAAAAEHYAQAINSDPADPELRKLNAIALYRCGKTKDAVDQAHIAMMLEPQNTDYRDVYVQAMRLHQQKYLNPHETVE